MQVVLAVNKCENVARADEQAADFWELGHQPIAISAISGTGTGDLMDALMEVRPLGLRVFCGGRYHAEFKVLMEPRRCPHRGEIKSKCSNRDLMCSHMPAVLGDCSHGGKQGPRAR